MVMQIKRTGLHIIGLYLTCRDGHEILFSSIFSLHRLPR